MQIQGLKRQQNELKIITRVSAIGLLSILCDYN